jgi:lysophospholipase L1-like esterase
MKPLKSFPSLVFLTLSLLGCSKNEAPTPTTENEVITTILPLGASRVAGARPFFESFRYPLWKQLIDGGWSFDFIGTRKDTASYEDYKGQVFDVDHEGRLGWTSGQFLNGIASWLEQAGTPEVVLFSSPGGNDALQGLSYEQALENIAAIIDILQDNNPKVTIIIEQMAPGRSDVMTPALTSLFETMKQAVSTLANAKTTAQSQVIAVDMFTGFNDSFFADGVHYNTKGAAFIADRYYTLLEQLLEE